MYIPIEELTNDLVELLNIPSPLVTLGKRLNIFRNYFMN